MRRPLALLLAPALAASLALAGWMHADGHTRAVTLCLPGAGIVVSRTDGTPASLDELARHEAVHLDQCRRLGAVRYYAAHVSRSGTLDLEAEAYAAGWRRSGHSVQACTAAVVTALHPESSGYRLVRGLPIDSVTRVAARRCAQW